MALPTPSHVSPVPPFYDSNYDLASLVGTVDGTTDIDRLIRPGAKTWILDALDQRFVDLLENIRFWNPIQWKGEKFTTFCYRVHGVQNTWMIVLAFNGLTSPLQLRPGMILRVPTKASIDESLKALQPKRSTGTGSRVTI